jgi:hypothetical protein
MARQQFINDTNVVLRVSFDERNDFGDFVWMVNNAKLFDYKRYVYIDNELYLFANPPPSPPMVLDLIVDTTWVDLHLPNYTPPTNWDIFWQRMGWKWQEFAYAARRSSLLCIGFMLLILLPCLIYVIKKARQPAGL